MQSVLEKLAQVVEGNFSRQTDFLSQLVRMPSDNPAGDCAPHAEETAKLLEAMGYTVERHPVPKELCQKSEMISATNLVIRHSFGPGPTVALNAHGDVVPPGLGWIHDPYGAEIEDGVMYGRGVAVSKSDIVTYAFALLALIEGENQLSGTVELHITYDEETGGLIGPRLILETGISRPDYAISAGFTHGAVTAHNGCLQLEVEVTGISAHAAEPDKGQDALKVATGILGSLYQMNEKLADIKSHIPGIGSPSLVIGLIKGGINTNVVPDHVSFRLDRRMIPEENPGQVEAELRSVINNHSCINQDGISVSINRVLLAEPLKSVPGTGELAALLVQNAEKFMDVKIPVHGVPIYADGRHYAERGIPTVMYGAGPRTIAEAHGHRADERLLLDDLKVATKVVVASLYELLKHKEV